MKQTPDKILTQNYASRHYQIHIYEKQDCAYIIDAQYPEPAFKFGPVNEMSLIDIANQARKAARYLTGMERDYKKLRDQGFEFLVAPKPTPQPRKLEAPKEERAALNLPKWKK